MAARGLQRAARAARPDPANRLSNQIASCPEQVFLPAVTRNAVKHLLSLSSSDSAGQCRPTIQFIDVACLGDEDTKGRLTAVLSDCEFFASVVLVEAAKQSWHGIQNERLLQFVTWRVIIETSNINVLVVNGVTYAVQCPNDIGSPNTLQPEARLRLTQPK